MRWNSFHDNSFTKSPSTDVPRAVSTVNGFDYQKFDRAVTWQEANATCIELGGILAMDTPEVHDFFAGLGKPVSDAILFRFRLRILFIRNSTCV